MGSKNSFWKKTKEFIKRNSYALVISFCVLVAFSVITTLSVADLYKDNNKVASTTQNQPEDSSKPEEDGKDVAPTSGETVIIFDCPVENCNESKEYAEDMVLEDKTSGVWKTHQGIDYAGTSEDKVFSVYDGTVESVEDSMMDGKIITIKHVGNLKTIYKSLGEVCVNEGDSVKKGEEIGKMGTSTNEQAEGVHLHFEVEKDGKLVDPDDYLATSAK
ncbi:MAG: M23 family metallopeptidase [Clostridia bacterium]|nr:M23 family metallopeptidase [Clostridia bacterium]